MNVLTDGALHASERQVVIAFDGDDTLWVDSSGEQAWERHFKHLAADRLPHPAMASRLRDLLDGSGYSIEAVQSALLTAGQDTCPDALPAEWLEQVRSLPDLARKLDIDLADGLHRTLDMLEQTPHRLWIITKGDLIRQAIKLARFGLAGRFDQIEIVDRKSMATYRAILDSGNVNAENFVMVGDSFSQDILPVLRLGASAIHLPVGKWTWLRPVEVLMPGRRLHVCRSLEDARQICL